MDIETLIEYLITYRNHIEQAIAHLEAASSVGARRGPGRPRKGMLDVQAMAAAASASHKSSHPAPGVERHSAGSKDPASSR